MGTPDQLLSNSTKLKINAEIKFMQDYFERVDSSIDHGLSKEMFLTSFSVLYDHYLDLQKHGSDRERAKTVLMMGLKNELAKMELEKNVLDG